MLAVAMKNHPLTAADELPGTSIAMSADRSARGKRQIMKKTNMLKHASAPARSALPSSVRGATASYGSFFAMLNHYSQRGAAIAVFTLLMSLLTLVAGSAGAVPLQGQSSNAQMSSRIVPKLIAPSSATLTVGSRRTVTTPTAFCYPVSSTGSLCGIVFCDSDCDNNYDCNDSVLSGVCVTLTDSSNRCVGTVTTDCNGRYTFSNLKPGNYYANVPSTVCGLTVSPYSPGVTVPASPCTTKNFGYEKPGNLIGAIWQDTNGNCQYDCGEPLLSGVCVTLLDAHNHCVATATTNCWGIYYFCNIPCGQYSVHVPSTYCGLVVCPYDANVCITPCQTACKLICYQCPPPPTGSLSITASVNNNCVLTTGNPVTYTYVVKNTGSVALNNIVVTDSALGSVGTINSLAAGASSTLTKTVTLSANTTSTATATGQDALARTVTAASNSVTVTTVHPSLGLTITPNPGTASPGDAVVLTYTVTNTGDIAVDNITVTDGQGNSVGTIAQLVPQAAQPFIETVTIPAGTTGSYSASGNAAGADDCAHSPATVTATTTVLVVPHALITGTVVCSDAHALPIAGATVQLLDSSNTVVSQTTTDANGAYAFPGIADGSYTVQVTDAPDWQPNSGAVTSYAHTGTAHTVNPIPLTPTPIVYREVQDTSGFVFFGNVGYYSRRATTGTTLTEVDLYNGAYASPDSTTSYAYVGYIPKFPELGHFGGPGEPTIYVIMTQPLLPETQWNNFSFSNQVGVYSLVGTGAVGTASDYIYRFLFSQPFDGPGTAHNYQFTGLESSAGSLTPASITPLPSVWIGGGTAPPAPLVGDLPAGWMAEGQGEFTLAPNLTTMLYVDGTYGNACGDLFNFHIHPLMGGGPDPSQN